MMPRYRLPRYRHEPREYTIDGNTLFRHDERNEELHEDGTWKPLGRPRPLASAASFRRIGDDVEYADLLPLLRMLSARHRSEMKFRLWAIVEED